MKIIDYPGLKSPKYQQVEGTQTGNEPRFAGKGSSRDRVLVSAKAKEIRRLILQAREMPETLSSRVLKIQSEIGTGTYRVMGAAVAEKMIKEMFLG